MVFRTILVAVAVSAFMLISNGAQAMSGQPNSVSVSTKDIQLFSRDEASIIRDVLRDIVLAPLDDHYDGGSKKGKGLPHGLAKRDGDLPPGLQKHIEKNGQLPPGLQKQALPSQLRSRLPIRRDGSEIVIVGDDVVLVETATNIVVDILTDVVRRGSSKR